MAYVTLYPAGDQRPMNYPDATNIEMNDGTLTFRAKKETNVPTTNKFVTNLPFLLIEE